MKICYFGTFDKNYLRNRIIIEGLKRSNVEVVFCHTKYTWFLWVYIRLAVKWFFLAKKQISAIIVGETGYVLMPLAKLLGLLWSKPVILDAYFSVHQTNVFDRRTAMAGSYEAKKLLFVEKMGCEMADLILLDTNAQINYFNENICDKMSHYMRVFVGADDKVFYPRQVLLKSAGNNMCKVLFWGSYIPLQGIEYIIRAAKLMESDKNLQFELIGKGQTYEDILKLTRELGVNNIRFSDYIDENSLVDKIAQADICLGIFGDSSKAANVIPNKVYQAIACAKPLITARTPATEEIFKDKENIMFCEAVNPRSIADKILELEANPELREKIAQNSYRLFKERFTPEKVVQELMGWINNTPYSS